RELGRLRALPARGARALSEERGVARRRGGPAPERHLHGLDVPRRLPRRDVVRAGGSPRGFAAERPRGLSSPPRARGGFGAFGRSFSLTTHLRPDHVSSIAQTFTSTRPAASATS